MALAPDFPDWRQGRDYCWLLETERAGFAWEWLRRDKGYRAASREALEARPDDDRQEEAALDWGLHRFEQPELPYDAARPVWTYRRHPWVVAARRVRSGLEDRLDLEALKGAAKMVRTPSAARLLLSDGRHGIRVDVEGGDLAFEPVTLEFQLTGLASLDRPLLILQRLRSLALAGRFVTSLHPPPRCASRLVLQLRAFDALRGGASHRDLAELLVTSPLERPNWRIHCPSLRSRAQRLAKAALRMAAGGFWDLLL